MPTLGEGRDDQRPRQAVLFQPLGNIRTHPYTVLPCPQVNAELTEDLAKYRGTSKPYFLILKDGERTKQTHTKTIEHTKEINAKTVERAKEVSKKTIEYTKC